MTQPNTPIEPPKPGTFPFPQLRLALSRLAGVPVMDPDRPIDEEGQTGDGEQAWIKATMTTRRAIGIDDQRTNADATCVNGVPVLPDPPPEDLAITIGGNRVQTVSLRAECIDGNYPQDVLERLRMGVRTVTGYNALTALGLAISSLEAIAYLGGQKVNGRRVLVAVMDIRFGWAVNLQAFDDQVTTIDTVDGGTQAPGTPTTIPGTVQPG